MSALRPRVSSLHPVAGDALASVPVSFLDAVAPSLPHAVAEIGSLPQWALAHAGKVSVKWDRHSAFGDAVQAMMQACRAGVLPDPAVVGTHDEARAWLAALLAAIAFSFSRRMSKASWCCAFIRAN